MALGPITAGQTLPIWTVTVKREDNSLLDLTGASFSGVLYDQQAGITKTLTVANYTASNPTMGVYTYTPIGSDVDTPGLWSFETAVALTSGTYYVTITNFRINPRLAT